MIEEENLVDFKGTRLRPEEVAVIIDFERAFGRDIPYAPDVASLAKYATYFMANQNHVTRICIYNYPKIKGFFTIPASIKNLTHLNTLNFSNCKFKEIPVSIGHLKNIGHLLMEDCKMNHFPLSIGKLRQFDTKDKNLKGWTLGGIHPRDE